MAADVSFLVRRLAVSIALAMTAGSALAQSRNVPVGTDAAAVLRSLKFGPSSGSGIKTQQTVDELSESARKMRDALVIIGFAGDDGSYSKGTGFIISRANRLIVTNAHVVDAWSDRDALFVIPNGSLQRYEVDKVWYHPGLIRISTGQFLIRSENPGDGDVYPSCPDVALIQLKSDGPDLPGEVVLARPDEIQDLSYLPVGLLGYPRSDTVGFPQDTDSFVGRLGLGTKELFTATFGTGVVSHLTDFNEKVNADARNNQRVEYTMSTTHGASGSPIFLGNGHVVALHNSGPEGEAALPIREYGIRIDCLWELLQSLGKGNLVSPAVTVDAAQLEQHRSWQPNQAMWDALAQLDTRRGKSLDDQKAICDAVIAKVSNLAPPYVARGFVYEQMYSTRHDSLSANDRLSLLNNASADFSTALNDDKSNVDALEHLAWVAYFQAFEQKGLDGDFSAPQQVLLGAKKDSWTLQERAYADRVLSLCAKYSPDAKTYLDEAIRFAPFPSNYLARADYYSHLGNSTQADADRNEANRLTAALNAAQAAEAKAQSNSTDSQSVQGALNDALKTAQDTQNQQWACVAAVAHIYAIQHDDSHALEWALKSAAAARADSQVRRSKTDIFNARKALFADQPLLTDLLKKPLNFTPFPSDFFKLPGSPPSLLPSPAPAPAPAPPPKSPFLTPSPGGLPPGTLPPLGQSPFAPSVDRQGTAKLPKTRSPIETARIKFADVPAAVRQAADRTVADIDWQAALKDPAGNYKLVGKNKAGQRVEFLSDRPAKKQSYRIELSRDAVPPAVLAAVAAKVPHFQPKRVQSVGVSPASVLAYRFVGTGDRDTIYVSATSQVVKSAKD